MLVNAASEARTRRVPGPWQVLERVGLRTWQILDNAGLRPMRKPAALHPERNENQPRRKRSRLRAGCAAICRVG